jgi:hypothetical protein
MEGKLEWKTWQDMVVSGEKCQGPSPVLGDGISKVRHPFEYANSIKSAERWKNREKKGLHEKTLSTYS